MLTYLIIHGEKIAFLAIWGKFVKKSVWAGEGFKISENVFLLIHHKIPENWGKG